MERVREWLRDAIDRLRGLAASNRLVATISALLLLAVTGLLVLMTAQPGKTTGSGQTSTQVAPPTSTIAPTQTLAPTATRVVIHVPPPPPIPPKPKATPTPKPSATPGGVPTPTPTPCGPGAYLGGNPTQDQIRQALYTAADYYGLPHNLLLAVAWQESRWHQDVYACDGGVGLMQIQYNLADDFNHATYINNTPGCGLTNTSYDVHDLAGNAHLGAKYLKYLSCYYSYAAPPGPSAPSSCHIGTSTGNPGCYTIAWYYQQAHLQYPDTLNADGTPNANSLCASVYNNSPENPALPSTTAQPWSCPYDPVDYSPANPNPGAIHSPDNTLLDVTLSAYNGGSGLTMCGISLCNANYVRSAEGFIVQFQNGTLPTAS